jgi:hypothetical protein
MSPPRVATFPAGFPGDKRNAFTAAGRTKEEQELFEYIRRLTTLRREHEPLRTGRLVNLYVAEQQYVYARVTRNSSVVVAFNNDDKPAAIEFDASPAGLRLFHHYNDSLGGPRIYVMTARCANLPKRSVAIYTAVPYLVNHVNLLRRDPQ